jgi:perosamine synthetase
MMQFASPDLTGNELKYVTDCIKSGWISHQGKYVAQFEQMFAHNMNNRVAICCSSGTAAIHLALLACNIGRGDEVIVPDLTFATAASAVIHCGATPVLVDVDENFGIKSIKGYVSERTKAVIPTHLYGLRCNMARVLQEANHYKLAVIEDCCEAVDIVPEGDFGCYSFFANKHITTGEGGMLVGSCTGLAAMYRDGGSTGNYYHPIPGLNYRMTNIQAAIGVAQMERKDELIQKRARVAARYAAALKGRGEWLFVAEVQDPVKMQAHLTNIETRRVFHPLHRQPPFTQEGDFPGADRAFTTGLCLPTGPHVTEAQADHIIERVRKYA